MFAIKTFERSGPGQEGKDNGLLILVSAVENAWRIEGEFDSEEILPDSNFGGTAATNLMTYLAVLDSYSGLRYRTYAAGLKIVTNHGGTHLSSGSPPPNPSISQSTLHLAGVGGRS